MNSERPRPHADPNDPLFSLPMDDGAGALIAAAAGDVAGRADPTAYSAITQAATVLAYHLLTNDGIDRDALASELVELAGGGGRFTYRMPSEAFEEWLESAKGGVPSASSWPSSEPAARAVPVGVFFRSRVDDLVRAAVASARLTHIDASTAVVAAAAAGAVAGSCWAQSGADLVLGAAETADRALSLVEEETFRFADVTSAAAVGDRLRAAASLTALEPSAIAEAMEVSDGHAGIDGALLAIVLGAAGRNEPIRLIEVAATQGGSVVAALTGGIVGARTGLIQWPWRVQNDTWFAELGRRLTAGPSEVRDLPIPYAVEERMMMATRARASEETI